jgi:hypothetical protein
VLRLQPSGPDIPTNAWASAVFDEPVDVTSASELVSVQAIGQGDSRRVPGRVVVSADASALYYQPDAPLDPNATYAVFLARTVRDLAGNTANLPTAGREFTTASGPDSTAPAMVASSPPDGSSGAPRNALPGFVMNMPIRWPRLESGDIELIVNGLAVPFELTLLLGDRGIQPGPEAPFAAGDIVTVRLNRAMSLPGETLASPAQFTFTVGAELDLTPPSVMDVSPAQSATDVPLDATFVLRLSEPIDPASISTASLNGPRGLVDFTAELDASRTTLRLTPKAPLEPQARYSVTVNNAIRDVAGNRLEQNFQFTTVGTAAAATSSLLRHKGR